MNDNEREVQTIGPGDAGPVEEVLGEPAGTEFPTEANGEYGSAEHHEGEPANITDITQLDLQTETLPEVDETKLADRLEYAPSMQPGKFYNFIFKLREDKPGPVEGVTIKNKLHAQFNYELIEVRDDGSTGKTIRFCQANTFRTGKMEASRAEELLFALGLLSRFQREKADHTGREKSFMLELLQEASGAQKMLRGQINWRRYDKNTKTTWSTAPAKPYKKIDKDTGLEVNVVEQPWPKDSTGKLINRPDDWEGNYGNEIISRVAPSKETLEQIKTESAGGAPAS